jgi:hypothetical protein
MVKKTQVVKTRSIDHGESAMPVPSYQRNRAVWEKRRFAADRLSADTSRPVIREPGKQRFR